MEHLSAQFQVIFSLPEAVMAFLDKKGTIQSHYYVRYTQVRRVFYQQDCCRFRHKLGDWDMYVCLLLPGTQGR